MKNNTGIRIEASISDFAERYLEGSFPVPPANPDDAKVWQFDDISVKACLRIIRCNSLPTLLRVTAQLLEEDKIGCLGSLTFRNAGDCFELAVPIIDEVDVDFKPLRAVFRVPDKEQQRVQRLLKKLSKEA